jgi:hypothetical protein
MIFLVFIKKLASAARAQILITAADARGRRRQQLGMSAGALDPDEVAGAEVGDAGSVEGSHCLRPIGRVAWRGNFKKLGGDLNSEHRGDERRSRSTHRG